MGTDTEEENPDARSAPDATVEPIGDSEEPATADSPLASRPALALVLAVVGFAVPVLGYLAFIHHFGLNVIARDQWTDVGTVEAARAGKLSFQNFWSPWAVERLFFPRFIVVALAYTTNLDLVTEMYISALLLFAGVALLIVSHRRRSPGTPLVYYAPVAVLLLSLVQYEDTLWGFQVAWYLVFLAFAVVVFLLDRDEIGWPVLVAAVAAAVVGSFSSFQGLLIWPAGVVLLLLRRRPPRLIGAWIAVGLVTIVLYFVGLNRPGNSLYGLEHPIAGLKFFFFVVGDIVGVPLPFLAKSPNLWVELFGVIVFACAVWVVVVYGIRRHPSGPQSVGVSMICFGLLWAVALTLSQSSAGIAGAAPSRFTLYSLLTLAGCYLAVIGGRGSPSPLGAVSRPAILGAVAIVALAGTVNGIAGGRTIYESRVVEAVTTVNAAQATPAQFDAAEPYLPGTIQGKGSLARQMRLSMFADPGVLASFERLGLAAGIWTASTVPHVSPWKGVHNGQELLVSGDGFGSSVDLVVSECTTSIVSKLSIGSLRRTGPAAEYFSSRGKPTSCVAPMVVKTDARGQLRVSYRISGGTPGAVRYVAVQNAKRTGVIAAAEILFA